MLTVARPLYISPSTLASSPIWEAVMTTVLVTVKCQIFLLLKFLLFYLVVLYNYYYYTIDHYVGRINQLTLLIVNLTEYKLCPKISVRFRCKINNEYNIWNDQLAHAYIFYNIYRNAHQHFRYGCLNKSFYIIFFIVDIFKK